jgi:hypothetical protein
MQPNVLGASPLDDNAEVGALDSALRPAKIILERLLNVVEIRMPYPARKRSLQSLESEKSLTRISPIFSVNCSGPQTQIVQTFFGGLIWVQASCGYCPAS